jgi:hypothetical protein
VAIDFQHIRSQAFTDFSHESALRTSGKDRALFTERRAPVWKNAMPWEPIGSEFSAFLVSG